jgi:hypothetical protein
LATFILPGYFGGVDYAYVPGTPELGWAWLQVNVWSVTKGATYEDAVASGEGGYGQSALFYAQGGGQNVLVTPRELIGLTSFSVLEPIPEPAVGWLAIGALAVLALARRAVKGRT